MAFPRLSDNPLFGDHRPLVLGWRDDQLRPIADQLAPWLPDKPTEQMLLAIASIARSIVAENKRSGRAVHYARGKEPYRQPKRYRDGDPWNSWYYVTGAMDLLLGAGLIGHEVGLRCQGHKGFQSVAWATERLMTLVGPLVDPSEPRGIPHGIETIILRDREDKTDVDYVDTADTVSMRDQLGLINHKLSQLELRYRGQYLHNPLIRRIFNGDFDRGGRLYCLGNSFQNMPAGERKEITFIIAGAPHPAVEIDYANLHITMAYAEVAEKPPHGDQYAIKGFDRGLVKLAVNILFNAPSIQGAIRAVGQELHSKRELRSASGIGPGGRSACHSLAEQVVNAIRRKHRRIQRYFGSDCGTRFQRKDSDIAIDVMTRMIHKTGRCPLPMHDSFLVPDIDAEVLKETMLRVAAEHGLRLRVKDSNKGQSVPSPGSLPLSPAPPIYSHSSPSCPSLPGPHSSFPSLPSYPSLVPYLHPISPTSSFPTIPSSLVPSPSIPLEVTPSDLRRSGQLPWSMKPLYGLTEAITETSGPGHSASGVKKRPRCQGPPAPWVPNGPSAATIAFRKSYWRSTPDVWVGEGCPQTGAADNG